VQRKNRYKNFFNQRLKHIYESKALQRRAVCAIPTAAYDVNNTAAEVLLSACGRRCMTLLTMACGNMWPALYIRTEEVYICAGAALFKAALALAPYCSVCLPSAPNITFSLPRFYISSLPRFHTSSNSTVFSRFSKFANKKTVELW
jgi:hypothetical protein